MRSEMTILDEIYIFVTFKDLMSTNSFSADYFYPIAASNPVTADHGTFSKAGSYE
jgi:hypothetical protein